MLSAAAISLFRIPDFITSGWGSYPGGSSNISVTNNSFTHNRVNGIQCGAVSNITITKNAFSDLFHAIGDHTDAIIFQGSKTASSTNIVVSDNIITRGKGESSQGIFLAENTGHLFSNVNITNNLLLGEGYHGIGVYGAQNVNVSGNDVVGYVDLKDWILLDRVSQATLKGNKASTYVFYLSDTGVVQSGNFISPTVTDGGTSLTKTWLSLNPSFSAALLSAPISTSGATAATAAASTLSSPISMSSTTAGAATTSTLSAASAP